jgi:hypothetical protein
MFKCSLEVQNDMEKISSLLTLAEVDREMKYVVSREYGKALRRHRNTLIPISKLPVEVLLLIFEHIAPLPRPDFSSIDLAFSQTCRLWRTNALSNPSLWRSPVFRYPKLAQEMLTRAADWPLNAELDLVNISFAACRTVVDMLSGQKLERVDAFANPAEMRDLIRLIMATSQQTLTYLRMRYSSYIHDSFLPLVRRPPRPVLLHVATEDTFFSRLRTLHLENCMIPSTSPLFSNLTILRLEISAGTGSFVGFNVATLVFILRKSPNLEELSLAEVVIDNDSEPPPPTSRSHQHSLTSLRRLKIHESRLFSLISLVETLNFPLVSTMEIRTRHSNHFPGSVDAMEITSQFLYRLTERVFPGHQVKNFSYDVSFEKIMFKTLGAKEDHSDFEFRFEIINHPHDNRDVLHEIPLCFSLARLQSCTVSIESSAIVHCLRPLWTYLGTNTSVIEINTRRYAYVGLQYAIEMDIDSPTSAPLFPSLNTLIIEKAHLAEYRVGKSYLMTALRLFALFLKRLQDAGRAIPEITLSNCIVPTQPRMVFERFKIHKTPISKNEFCLFGGYFSYDVSTVRKILNSNCILMPRSLTIA